MKSGIRKTTSAGLLAVSLAASMLLAGCAGDTKSDASASSNTSSPKTAAPTTTSAAPTPTASPTTDPNVPAAARAHTQAGAEAFVRYFIERLNLAWTEPRVGMLSPLCQPSAKACAAFERDATRLAKERHHYDGNPVTISFVGVLDTSPKTYDVLANLVQERRNEIDAAGKVYVTDSRKNVRLHFKLLYTGHAWSAATIKVMK